MRISDWSSDVCSSDLLCKEGKGHAPRFACPYHNWTYDREGKLVGISGKDKFGAEVGEDLGLTELPAIEAAGVIWGALTPGATFDRSEEHTSELQSLMRISYAVFCLKKKTQHHYAIHH